MLQFITFYYRITLDNTICQLHSIGVYIAMYLTGYHGTSEKWAKKVLETHTFKISDGDKEWLGRGIYFYESFGDAYAWNNSEVILHSVIKINDDEYVDFDTVDGAKLYNKIVTHICENMSITVDGKSSQKNQCAVMNMLWDMC